MAESSKSSSYHESLSLTISLLEMQLFAKQIAKAIFTSWITNPRSGFFYQIKYNRAKGANPLSRGASPRNPAVFLKNSAPQAYDFPRLLLPI